MGKGRRGRRREGRNEDAGWFPDMCYRVRRFSSAEIAMSLFLWIVFFFPRRLGWFDNGLPTSTKSITHKLS